MKCSRQSCAAGSTAGAPFCMSSCTVQSVLRVTTAELSMGQRLSAFIASIGAVRGFFQLSSTRRRVCLRFGGPSVGAVAFTTDISTYVRLAIMRLTFSTPTRSPLP